MTKYPLYKTQIGSDLIYESFTAFGDVCGETMLNRNLVVYQLSSEDLLGFTPYLDKGPYELEILEYLKNIYDGSLWDILVLFTDPTASYIDPRFMDIIDSRYDFVTKRWLHRVICTAQATFDKILELEPSTIVNTFVSGDSKNINKFPTKKVVKKLDYNLDAAYICIMLLIIATNLAERKKGNVEDFLLENKEFTAKLFSGLIEYEAVSNRFLSLKEQLTSIVNHDGVKSRADKFVINRILKSIRYGK